MKQYNVTAEYNQIQLYDTNNKKELAQLADLWNNDKAIEQGIVTSKNKTALGLQTARNGTIKIKTNTVEKLETNPKANHVVQTEILVEKELVIEDILEENPQKIDVVPGEYVMQYSVFNMDTISEDGLEGKDYYQLEFMLKPTSLKPERKKIKKENQKTEVVVQGEWPGG